MIVSTIPRLREAFARGEKLSRQDVQALFGANNVELMILAEAFKLASSNEVRVPMEFRERTSPDASRWALMPAAFGYSGGLFR